MSAAVVRRWSRRVVHPRLVLATADVAAAVDAIEVGLAGRGFRTTRTGAGFRARRRPWLGWLSAAASTSCVVAVRPTSATIVEVDVEERGNHPAPTRVAEALTDAAARLAAAGVAVRWGEWEAVP